MFQSKMTKTVMTWVFGLGCLSATGLAQAYPDRPIKLIVPWAAGGDTDNIFRPFAPGLQKHLGQPVVIANVGGASGMKGAKEAKDAPADGYTLLMGGINLAINPSLYRDMQYELQRDFRPVALVGVAPLVIVANPSLPASTITELVALSRQGDKPILYGSGGNGSITHLALEMLKSQTGAALSHVPYKGIAQMMTDVIGNQIPLACPALASALGAIQSGRIKALAVTTAQRSSLLPSVPTVREAGIADFDVSAWNGLLAPARTPDEAVARILSDVDGVVRMPEFVEGLRKQALEPDFRGPEAFRSFLAGELDKWSRLARASGARMD
jgi:tripartite-type tricarboxylate transporter receptor subunit TctC